MPNNENKATNAVVSPTQYFNILSRETQTTDIEKVFMSNFEEHVLGLMKYEDYLNDIQKSFLDNYRRQMLDLIEIEESQTNTKLNSKQLNAIGKYNEMTELVKNQINAKQRKLEKINPNVSSGVANAFIVVLSIIATGIVIGICGFFLM